MTRFTQGTITGDEKERRAPLTGVAQCLPKGNLMKSSPVISSQERSITITCHQEQTTCDVLGEAFLPKEADCGHNAPAENSCSHAQETS